MRRRLLRATLADSALLILRSPSPASRSGNRAPYMHRLLTTGFAANWTTMRLREKWRQRKGMRNLQARCMRRWNGYQLTRFELNACIRLTTARARTVVISLRFMRSTVSNKLRRVTTDRCCATLTTSRLWLKRSNATLRVVSTDLPFVVLPSFTRQDDRGLGLRNAHSTWVWDS